MDTVYESAFSQPGGGDYTGELIDGDSPHLREQRMLACLLWDGLTEQVSQRSDTLL